MGSSNPLLSLVLVLLSILFTYAQPPAGTPSFSPTISKTFAPSPTSLYETESPTGAATITHDPDWTEAQLISVILGSVVGLTAVVLAVYCAYARGCFEEGPKISSHRVNELPNQSSPLLDNKNP